MNKVFNYFKLWGNGFVQAFGPLFVISVSCLYALPILFIGEIFELSVINNNQESILFLTAFIVGPILVAKHNWGSSPVK